MKTCILFACLLTLLAFGVFASAEITISGADAITNFGLSEVEIATDEIPLDEIFISGEDAVT
ncbi:MAG: hypothetical protein KAR87_06490 [Candidatus Aenigmarchaeota archaeon]|nr:hypothetical protein [Candidatus Aenigmarchaeota archaeon]